ncbi:hypothetical protein C0J52_06182 [Blattella germanica]|nr:hypothetical protein C0J52_06182 [Blattella germanica]
MVHTIGFSPEWSLLCAFSESLVVSDLPQMSQRNKFSPVYITNFSLYYGMGLLMNNHIARSLELLPTDTAHMTSLLAVDHHMMIQQFLRTRHFSTAIALKNFHHFL